MAPVAVDVIERRRERRRAGGGRVAARRVIRPGQWVTLINICSRAALVESARGCGLARRPRCSCRRRRARASVRGRLDRCYVAALDPMRYRGVFMFDSARSRRRGEGRIASSKCPCGSVRGHLLLTVNRQLQADVPIIRPGIRGTPAHQLAFRLVASPHSPWKRLDAKTSRSLPISRCVAPIAAPVSDAVNPPGCGDLIAATERRNLACL